jgi:apolipoprotein N-acyltransferase
MAERAPGGGAIGLLLRRPWSSAAVAGLLLAAALPPFHVLPGILGLAVPALLLRHDARHGRALAATFVFAFAFALAGLWWVGISFFTDPTRYAAFAVPAVLGLAAAYGATVTLALAPLRLLRFLPPALFAFAFALAWMAGELLRASPWLRFPWNPLASVWAVSDTTLAAIAWIGVGGLGLVTAGAAALAGAVVEAERRRRPAPAAMVLLCLLAVPALGAWRGLAVGEPDDTAVRVRLVQANIAQHHKWDPSLMADWFRRHLELTARATDAGPPRLIVWPESSVPYDVEGAPEVLAAIADAMPRGAQLVFGADRYVERDGRAELTNSLYLVDDRGHILDRYDKVDLVPYGEFLPFRRLLRRLGLRALTASSIDYQPGPGRRTLVADGLPPFSPLICYEAAYAGRATDGSGRAQLLVNITNDGWFGESPGPYQHFAMARMRAVESGLPLLRAANTGISAIVDGLGRVRASLPLGVTGVVDGTLPPALPAPPIARWPALPFPVAVVLGILCAAVDFRRGSPDEWRRRAPASGPADAARDRTR